MSGFPVKISDYNSGIISERRFKEINTVLLANAANVFDFDATNYRAIVMQLGSGASSGNSYIIYGSNDGRVWNRQILDSLDTYLYYPSDVAMCVPGGETFFLNTSYRYYRIATNVMPTSNTLVTIFCVDNIISKKDIGINIDQSNNIRKSASATTESDIEIQAGGAPYKRVVCSVFEIFNNGTEAISFTLCGTYPVDPSACTPLLKGTVQPGDSYKWDKVELAFPTGGQGARLAFDAHTNQNIKYNFFGYFSR